MAPPIHLKWTQKCLTWVSRGFLFGGQLDGMNRLHSRLFARPLTSSKLTSTFLNCPFELNYTTESLGSQSSPSVHPTSRIPEHPRASQSIPEGKLAPDSACVCASFAYRVVTELLNRVSTRLICISTISVSRNCWNRWFGFICIISPSFRGFGDFFGGFFQLSWKKKMAAWRRHRPLHGHR